MSKVIGYGIAFVVALVLVTSLWIPQTAQAAFGLTSDSTYYTVNTGAGLVFKIRRVDPGSSTQSVGDIASLVYNGVEYQDQSRGSQVNSGFDWIYSVQNPPTVSAQVINTNYILITVLAGNLTHYYMARSGYPNIYMGTYFTSEPDTQAEVRYIARIWYPDLPNGPVPSDINGTTTTVESGDIFGLPDGETRSKHYSNMRLMDWQYIGATGTNVGIWMVRDNNEGNSGGPFYRCLNNQGDSDQEITYMINYGMAQTEPYRLNILNTYEMVFTNGTPPALPIDTSFEANLNLIGYIPASSRGTVTGVGINGRDPNYTYTVGFSNSTAQYWANADPTTGAFSSTGMIPGTYAMTVYKNEIAVWTGTATVTAGNTQTIGPITITGDPSAVPTIWRIGDWDGSPQEFLNANLVTYMHPSDVSDHHLESRNLCSRERQHPQRIILVITGRQSTAPRPSSST